mgnify:CR=1 FL=1
MITVFDLKYTGLIGKMGNGLILIQNNPQGWVNIFTR